MRVLITGGAGLVGGFLRARLPRYGHELRLLDTAPVDGAETVVGDIRDAATLDGAMRDVAAVVHLAGIATEAPFRDILDVNINGTYQVFEAARRAGVRRMVFASSNHATGFTPRPAGGAVPDDVEPRPDTLYGVTKVFGEALGRYYADRYGFDVACLRIGTFAERPRDRRGLATWLSPDDCTRLVDAALRAPDLGFAVLWGVSANTRRWWSLAGGRAVGYDAQDDAERFAAELEAEAAPTDDLVGGPFTGPTYGIDEVEERWSSGNG